MNSHNRNLLAGANTILAILDECGFQGVICGGFARDVYFDRNAKDIDIAVGVQEYSVSDLADLVARLEDAYPVKAFWTGDVHPKATSDNDYLDDPRCAANAPSEPTEQDHCVRLVVQIPRLHLDIVFYDTEHEAGNLVAQHDCNLNQFALAGTTPVFLGTFHPDKHGLRITREGLHPDRIAYMEAKWDSYQGIVSPKTSDLPL
ncbi:putative nucleotidyltransferase [Pseudomonas phage Alpheus]|uniref:Putative nucleotidyltransferase n=1 Tax=Pseudomonas phage Alpheus TaxID=2163983 RepID=A0A2S1GMX2_9CAUD|nr:nucleotidyltransferase [Pseudomonas phage Alpheus]AWD90737.1 putative nucleotidyltransferase [Pseudomonas phage Alpheus]